jgi:hypothetical protein
MLIDAHRGFAVRMMDGHGRVGGATEVIAVGQTHFVQPIARKIGCERHRLGTLAGLLIMKITKPNIRRCMRGVLPVADERGVHLIHNDARQVFWIRNNEWNQLWAIYFSGRVDVWDSVRMGFWTRRDTPNQYPAPNRCRDNTAVLMHKSDFHRTDLPCAIRIPIHFQSHRTCLRQPKIRERCAFGHIDVLTGLKLPSATSGDDDR